MTEAPENTTFSFTDGPCLSNPGPVEKTFSPADGKAKMRLKDLSLKEVRFC